MTGRVGTDDFQVGDGSYRAGGGFRSFRLVLAHRTPVRGFSGPHLGGGDLAGAFSAAHFEVEVLTLGGVNGPDSDGLLQVGTAVVLEAHLLIYRLLGNILAVGKNAVATPLT